MATFDLSKNGNGNPHVLWQQVVVRVRNNSAVNNVEAVSYNGNGGLNVQFRHSTKVYQYIGKHAVARLLNAADAQWWLSLPF